MPTLASELRNKLERVVIGARDAAEIGARAGLEALAVDHHAAYPHMKPEQIELRNHLRARALQLLSSSLSGAMARRVCVPWRRCLRTSARSYSCKRT